MCWINIFAGILKTRDTNFTKLNEEHEKSNYTSKPAFERSPLSASNKYDSDGTKMDEECKFKKESFFNTNLDDELIYTEHIYLFIYQFEPNTHYSL